MDRSALLACVRESLSSIDVPRLYETERGFQGELLAQLSRRLKLEYPAILEQEYQKRLQHHGLAIRPDLVIHEPFDPKRHADRRQGNLAVIELKLNATEDQACEDFGSLAAMLRVLEYPLGVFVNVGSTHTHAHAVPAEAKGRVVCFAVSLSEGKPSVIEEQT